MKPYFLCNGFLTPIWEVGVFLKAFFDHNFCTTEKKTCIAYFFALIKNFLCWPGNYDMKYCIIYVCNFDFRRLLATPFALQKKYFAWVIFLHI